MTEEDMIREQCSLNKCIAVEEVDGSAFQVRYWRAEIHAFWLCCYVQ